MDRYLQRLLKNWATQRQPPEHARARLLLSASARSYPIEESPVYLFEEYHPRPTDIYNLQRDEPARARDLLWMFHLSSPELRMI